MLYLLDASMLITANKSYYPVDSVPEFWEWLLYMAEQGSVKIPLEIFEEIKDGPDNEEKDLLFGWVQKLDVSQINFGKGNRMIVAGGKFDRKYQITVPV